VARWGATADDLWVGLYAHGDADGATLGLLRARLTALRGKPIRDKVWRGKISIGSDRGYRDVDDMDGFSLGGRHVEPEVICTSAAGRCKENAFKDAVVLGLINPTALFAVAADLGDAGVEIHVHEDLAAGAQLRCCVVGDEVAALERDSPVGGPSVVAAGHHVDGARELELVERGSAGDDGALGQRDGLLELLGSGM